MTNNTTNKTQSSKITSRPKVGLALGGGFIRATAQIGVIEVLREHNIPIDMISGCSSGCAVAASYTAGTVDQLKKRLVEGSRKEYWKIIFEPTLSRQGILKGARNKLFWEEFVGNKTFADLERPLFLTATDMVNMEEVIMAEGELSSAVNACTAVPGIFVPVKWQDRLLVDGANFNLIPSRVLYKNGADYVIAVGVAQTPNMFTQFASRFKKNLSKILEKYRNDSHTPDTLTWFRVIRRAYVLSSAQIENFEHHTYPFNTLIEPNVKHIKRTSVDKVEYCIEEGRKAAEKMIPQIKADLGML